MATFSERYGYKVRAALQVEEVDKTTRNCLWSVLHEVYWSTVRLSQRVIGGTLLHETPLIQWLCAEIYRDLFKYQVDGLTDDWSQVRNVLNREFFDRKWYEVYDFIEFVAARYPDPAKNRVFMERCNAVLESEACPYRFVGGQVVKIVDPIEIDAIETALKAKPDPVQTHLQSALEKLSDRTKRDYRNSVKESISAVEAVARSVTGEPKALLDDALRVLETGQKLHPALNEAFRKLYAYTSDAGGIRHALTEQSHDVTFEEAKFMLVACAAFVNLVLASGPVTPKP